MEIISIVIPVYNKEIYIDKCLTSVVDQTYSDLEIVVIDDGSTDNSAGIIQKYADNDSRIKFVQQPNKGHSEARNEGIRNTLGKYIFFLDADDFLPNKYVMEKMHSCMSAEKADIVLGEIISNSSGKKSIAYGTLTIDFSKTGIQVLHDLICQNKYFAVMCSKLYKTDLIKDNDLYFKALINDDEEWTPKIFSYANKISFINHECYERVIVETSVTRIVSESSFLRKALDKITVCNSLDSFFEKNQDSALSKLIFSFYLSSIYSLVFNDLNETNKKKLLDQLIDSKHLICHAKKSYLYKHKMIYYFYQVFGFEGVLKLLKLAK